ncbi:MAG: hypothetical protein WB762_03720 [Candidatus Sulfotelmatobacter sp.]
MAFTMKRARKHLVRGLLFVGLGLLLLLVGVGIATTRVMTHFGGSTATCGPPPPFVKPRSPGQAVFTAHVLYVGRIDPKYAMLQGHRFGPWALAYVKHRYWGLPWWSSGIVVVAPGWFQQGGDYFVDGKRWLDDSSKFLPLVYTGPCNRTELLSDAVVDTRLLSQGPPSGEVRIIGRTYRRKSGGRYEPTDGMQIEITGPRGQVTLTSDADAIYELDHVPAGHYNIQIDHPDRRDYEEGGRDKDLSPGDVWGRDVFSQ